MDKIDLLERLRVPRLLRYLWYMVNDPKTDEVICWHTSNNGFIIKDKRLFVQQYLPMYYNHEPYYLSTFLHQLYRYNFQKVSSTTNEQYFLHEFFIKDDLLMLTKIKLKIIKKKPKLFLNTVENIENICTSVKNMKRNYSTIEVELKSLEQENGTLCNDINDLHLTHAKQTKIINNITRILMHYDLSQTCDIADENYDKSTDAGSTIFELDSNGCPHEFWKKLVENKYSTNGPSRSSNSVTYNRPFGVVENSNGQSSSKPHLELASSTTSSALNQTNDTASQLEIVPKLLDELEEPPVKKFLFDGIKLVPIIDEHVEVPWKTVALNSVDKTTPVCAENLGKNIASPETELRSLQEALSALSGSEIDLLFNKLFQDPDDSVSDVVNSSNKYVTSGCDPVMKRL